jgi:hypothetical protein
MWSAMGAALGMAAALQLGSCDLNPHPLPPEPSGSFGNEPTTGSGSSTSGSSSGSETSSGSSAGSGGLGASGSSSAGSSVSPTDAGVPNSLSGDASLGEDGAASEGDEDAAFTGPAIGDGAARDGRAIVDANEADSDRDGAESTRASDAEVDSPAD